MYGGGANIPLLSIIVPVYNVEKYLRRCLDSLVNQTLKDIEIIVVNDASPDNSEDIVLEYAAKDSRIVYIKHEENKRQGAARNTGIKAARGQYITFVDSDDYVDSDLYHTVIRAFQKTKTNVVIFPTYVFNQRGYIDVGIPVTPARICSLPAEKYALDLGFATAWNKAYRREDLEKYEIYFPENTYWEDIVFWVQYCSAVQPKATSLSQFGPGYWYRQHSQSVNGMRSQTASQTPKIYHTIYQILKKYDYLENLAESFYQLISYLSYYMWDVLEAKRRSEFLAYFDEFVQCINFSTLPPDFAPEWRLMGKLSTQEEKTLLMQIYTQKYQAQNNPWLLFGCLSGKEKMKKIQKSLASRLFKFSHLVPFAQAMRRILHLNKVLV